MSKTLKPQFSRERQGSLVPFAPWLGAGFPDISRMFDSFFQDDFPADAIGTRLDVSETDQAVEVRVDLPGMAADDIDIRVENNVLVIRGERKQEHEEHDKERQFHRVERQFGSFSRSVMLPATVNDAEAVAEFQDGVLKVILPKSEVSKARRIAVK